MKTILHSVIKGISLVIAATAIAGSAYGAPDNRDSACFDQAAQRYRIPASILRSISQVESSGNPLAINRNANGSRDIGHMQINSIWLPVLARHGISQQDLFDPCMNTHVGAWILANNIRRMGYGWKAIGAYNARSPIKAAIYQRKIAANLYSKGKQID